MERVLIGFGSNEGDSVAICLGAVEAFRRHPDIRVLKVSSLYRTQPVGLTDQSWFINGVIQCETTLAPEELLELCLEIEKEFGRVRKVLWGPRTLDLDILSYGDAEIILPHLQVPHPRLHERRFVLVPLAEIAPHWVHPSLKMPVQELLARLSADEKDQEVVQVGVA